MEGERGKNMKWAKFYSNFDKKNSNGKALKNKFEKRNFLNLQFLTIKL